MLATLSGSHDLMWLGLGTTLGVAVQFLCLVPSLFRSDLWRLSLRFNLQDSRAARGRVDWAAGRCSSWCSTNSRSSSCSPSPSASVVTDRSARYTYGWSFMQMPYAVVVVSVLGVLTPQLAGLSTAADFAGLSERLRFGLRHRWSSSSRARWSSWCSPNPSSRSSSTTPTRATASRPAPCSRCSPPDCRASPSSNSACADSSRCSARVRSSLSTRAERADHRLVRRTRASLDRRV